MLDKPQGNILKSWGSDHRWNILFTLGADMMGSKRVL
jgi:hypothetical protein